MPKKKERIQTQFNPLEYLSRKRNRILIWSIVGLTVLSIIYLIGSPKVYERVLPKLYKAYIVQKEENEKIACDKSRTAVIGENIIMYAVIEGRDILSRENVFFTQAERITLKDKPVPDDRIEKWDRFWKQLKIGWIKIEPLFLYFDGRGKKDLSFLKYKHRWRYDGFYYWALPADSKPTAVIEYEIQQLRSKNRKTLSDSRNYAGTMFHAIYAYLHSDSDTMNPIREVKSPGIEDTGSTGLSPDIMRVTFVEDRSFKGLCTGYFNVPFVQGNEDLILQAKATERYIAISNRSYIYESAVQAGYDLKEKTLKGLRDACQVIYKELFLSRSNNVYSWGQYEELIRFHKNGVRPGDILVWGAEKNMAVLYSDGGLESKPNGIFDGTDVIIAAGKNGLEKNYLANVVDDKFEIWRLVKKKE